MAASCEPRASRVTPRQMLSVHFITYNCRDDAFNGLMIILVFDKIVSVYRSDERHRVQQIWEPRVGRVAPLVFHRLLILVVCVPVLLK